MAQLKKLSLYHFKNYIEKTFNFSKRIVCIYGLNGSGKTTVLDAVYYLCFTKSYFQHIDANCITKGHLGMRILGSFENDFHSEIRCIIRENGKKEFSLDTIAYTQFSKHIGKFPCVFITPDDTSLISEGSEIRRRFLDLMISQTNHSYLDSLIQYNKCLQQRNSLLKLWSNGAEKDFSLLAIYNNSLHKYGTEIYTIRKGYCLSFIQHVHSLYKFLSDQQEEIAISYSSQLELEPLQSLLERNIEKDIITQRTNYGIHKDDLVFTLFDMPFKQVASQGQRKSFLFSLKLAQYELIKSKLGKEAILLLDDIFEKLDEARSKKLMDYLVETKAQIFITDTHFDRLQNAFLPTNQDVEFLNVNMHS